MILLEPSSAGGPSTFPQQHREGGPGVGSCPPVPPGDLSPPPAPAQSGRALLRLFSPIPSIEIQGFQSPPGCGKRGREGRKRRKGRGMPFPPPLPFQALRDAREWRGLGWMDQDGEGMLCSGGGRSSLSNPGWCWVSRDTPKQGP